ncbi:MAG: helix-turn-helix transcriptional regulator [Methylovulum sp.]|uniref:helix-turn-helix domain-containing protein n=1 Tax=Methylovulum sp. TaxID=1916980 RepID=UPI002637B959|nr:helix-turn-helix transcriptional regulator [Methylovulum sp.]MDD2723255.1 helix-turn-helix transcriptional regulator [Methylovulum sp.]MDD5123424.1 helix-turn-helix transcriptional regulator [Methylovulum sp.]
MKIQEKLRFMREARNWSQEEMAMKLNMSTNGYAKIERGETKASIPKLEQISEILDMDLMELLSFGEKQVVCLIGDSNNGFNVMGSSKELAAEIQNLQLVISHKEEVIGYQKREIAYLQEMLAMLKAEK